MDVQDTALVDGGGFKTQKDHDVQLSGHSDKSLSNGNDGFQVSKRIGCQAQRMVSEKRRFSPRLIEIPESKRPYYGTSRKESQHCPIDEICKGNDNGNNGFQVSKTIGCQAEMMVLGKRRFSPRLIDIPESERPYYGTSRKEAQHCPIEEICKGNDNGDNGFQVPKTIGCQAQMMVSEKRRFSPRLIEIPESERPYYGTSRKESQHCPIDEICKGNDNGNNGFQVPKTIGCQAQMMVSEKRRFSPRLIEIPESERPYYGTSRKESQHGPIDKICKGNENGNNGFQVSKRIGCHAKMMVSEKRRFSPRLIEIPESERPYYGTSRKESQHCPIDKICKGNDNGDCSKKISASYVGVKSEGHTYHDYRQKCSTAGDEVSKSDSTILDADSSSTSSYGEGNNVFFDSQADDTKWLVSSTNADYKSAYAKVKETLRIYNTFYLQAVQEEENRCSASEKETGDCNEDVKAPRKRPDLKATSKMKHEEVVLYPKKRFGHLPGIDVGYQFYSRAEMVAIGFHSYWLNGIDYIGKSSGAQEYKGHRFPLAVAIVLSGLYEDDQDNSEDIIYTGQGGNDLLGKKHQVKDQGMSRGNLALKNNFEQSIPVRVVRGHKTHRNNSVKVYTYDGLYKVVECWSCTGVSGFIVYKYRLQRIKGQPQLTTNQVQFINGSASNIPPRIPGLVCDDICGGQEKIPIRVINLIDDTTLPTGFTYSKSIQVGENVKLPSNASGCKCKGSCTNPKTCACARLNGLDFPYVRRDGGRLIEAKDVVFECGPNCGCGPECINRISQRGIKYQLEIFRTPNKGWALRTLDFIPSGAPVCEYTGVLRRTDDLDSVSVNDYIFEIDGWQTMKGIDGRERRLGDVSASLGNHLEKVDDKTLEEGTPEFCIDAGSVGNVARFINHSCEPNLFVQCVLSTHHDMRLARVVLFAADSISPWQELTYDYAYALDSVVDSSGKIVQLPCHCGTNDCRKRLY